jgi:sugar/nucleoside kinase (ribokinase family)
MQPLLAIGTAAVDIKARLARSPLPTTDVPGAITIKAGGVARNIAENLARLNVPIVFAGIMGDDPQARLLIELSRAAGLVVRPIARSAPAPTDPIQTARRFTDGYIECRARPGSPPDRRRVQRCHS